MSDESETILLPLPVYMIAVIPDTGTHSVVHLTVLHTSTTTTHRASWTWISR
jgi:hypothetical protein